MQRDLASRYKLADLTGLETTALIIEHWQTGRYQTIAEVTSEVHKCCPSIPRSAIFWLAYHTIHAAIAAD